MKQGLQKVVVGLGSLVASAAALAQTAPETADYSTIGAAVSVGGVITAIVAMGVLKVGPNVAKWATNKLASFFR